MSKLYNDIWMDKLNAYGMGFYVKGWLWHNLLNEYRFCTQFWIYEG